ncbi:succinate dehydrogenase, cytochrome b556 subunit [Endozoicomonas ascidiicola]|uniref:succinate dehydrogenase, cytochrome b556 subunit n=1 Tax=Endozoicomonas ascidiicola TaxID=1698521 RepID=UPI000B2BF0B0
MFLLILLCTPSGVGAKRVNSKRPVNLDITTIKLPLPAYTSILHRISGIILFVGLGFLLYGLELSLTSEEAFGSLKSLLLSPLAKFIVWGILSALIYHFVAGVKHLLMDVDIGDGKESGKFGAIVTLVLSVVLIILAGVWVW